MIVYNKQKGIGLIEVLVALFILALGVLGFSALQLRALDASQEATEQTAAMNVARDLAERMRVNRTALADYKTAVNTKETSSGCSGTSIVTVTAPELKTVNLPKCNASNMATFDAQEMLSKAAESGHTLIIANCVGSTLNCIYVAWADTVISAKNINTCVDATTGSYITGSKCLVVEAF